jgi:hypothetical protein
MGNRSVYTIMGDVSAEGLDMLGLVDLLLVVDDPY